MTDQTPPALETKTVPGYVPAATVYPDTTVLDREPAANDKDAAPTAESDPADADAKKDTKTEDAKTATARKTGK